EQQQGQKQKRASGSRIGSYQPGQQGRYLLYPSGRFFHKTTLPYFNIWEGCTFYHSFVFSDSFRRAAVFFAPTAAPASMISAAAPMPAYSSGFCGSLVAATRFTREEL